MMTTLTFVLVGLLLVSVAATVLHLPIYTINLNQLKLCLIVLTLSQGFI
jgi:hypothetical protein